MPMSGSKRTNKEKIKIGTIVPIFCLSGNTIVNICWKSREFDQKTMGSIRVYKQNA